MEKHRLAKIAVLVLGLVTVGLVAWGTFRSSPALYRPYAPITLGGGAAMIMLLPDRSLPASVLRLVAVGLCLIGAILWTTA